MLVTTQSELTDSDILIYLIYRVDAVLRTGLGDLRYRKAASGFVPNLRVYVILIQLFLSSFYNCFIKQNCLRN